MYENVLFRGSQKRGYPGREKCMSFVWTRFSDNQIRLEKLIHRSYIKRKKHVFRLHTSLIQMTKVCTNSTFENSYITHTNDKSVHKVCTIWTFENSYMLHTKRQKVKKMRSYMTHTVRSEWRTGDTLDLRKHPS